MHLWALPVGFVLSLSPAGALSRHARLLRRRIVAGVRC
eukprot:COSAG02_NODE_33409_length_500_cov_1.134663_1_plen_37_part_10